MPPAKVLFLVNTLRVGGFERDVATLCEHIDRNRFLPEVWILHGGGQFEERVLQAGIRVRNLERGWSRNPLFAWKTARRISQTDADLVHAFLPSIATYGAIARSLFGVRPPMILSLGQSYTQRGQRWMFRWCSRTFDWLVANSASAEALGRSLGFDSSRISIIPNGHPVNAPRQTIDRQAVRAALGVRANDRMLLCVGRLIDTKRVCDLVEAVGMLGGQTSIKLVIVGEGPERGALAAQVSRLGLSEKISFAGHRNDVASLLEAADLFVFPSETEGLPNALIEACLAGLPIVACDVAGVRDVVRHEETALLAPPRDPASFAAAIGRLLETPTEAARLAAAAHDRATKTYTVERSLTALYDVYDRLLGTPKRPPFGEQPVPT